jgi:hypothetical protein
MAAVDDVDELIELFHSAQGEFVKGNPEPVRKLLSRREDVTLNNPSPPPARGWDEVAWTMERAASQFREGEFISAEIVANLPTRARRDGDRSLFEWSSGR